MNQLNQVLPYKLTGKIITEPEKLNEYTHEGDVMNDKKTMDLSVNEKIEKNLAIIREQLKLPDHETAARWAISLFSDLLVEQKKGNEIYLQGKDGKKYRYDFPTGDSFGKKNVCNRKRHTSIFKTNIILSFPVFCFMRISRCFL